ncbi:hypothetical protein Ancab_035536 [Ancistrocladus abbreviatus]
MGPIRHPWAFTFGLLGNIISFMVYLAPLPTFIRICKRKSTEGFQSIPYIFATFSAMLWVYYGLLKTNSFLLLTINSLGCVIELIYIAVYLTYAPKQAKIQTFVLLLSMNLGGFCLIILLCHYLAKGPTQVRAVGCICVAFSVCVFAAPLSVMKTVIRTKSVEFMPFWLSLFLTLSAIMWFFYGMLKKDLYVLLPNILGFVFGVAQMILYGIYKNCDKLVENQKLPEDVPNTVKLSCITTVGQIHPVDCPPKIKEIKEEARDQVLHSEIKGISDEVTTIQLVECVV